jgi:hypothetical protein
MERPNKTNSVAITNMAAGSHGWSLSEIVMDWIELMAFASLALVATSTIVALISIWRWREW